MSFSVVDRRSRSRVAFAGDVDQDENVRLTLSGRDFIFAQTSIVCSVMTEQNSHLIRPETARYVNANGDGWTNESLKANYETFIGAFNFVNHVQIPEKSVGFLADAALRKIWLDLDQQIWIYYVDILVATSRKFGSLCDLIATNKIKFLSMGCDMDISTCSACGNQATDDITLCDHLLHNKGKSFIDRSGLKRITCEMLGNDQPGSCKFVEASWLTEPPASGAAVKRSLLPVGPDQFVVVQMPRWAAERQAVQMWAGDAISDVAPAAPQQSGPVQ